MYLQYNACTKFYHNMYQQYCNYPIIMLQFWAVPTTRMCKTPQRAQGKASPANGEKGVSLLYNIVGTSPWKLVFVFCRNPGKDMDKQWVVEHDQLIQEFEELTTDPDGLLGVLEDALHEYGDEANFEAKRLLCALFQVQIK